MYKRQAVYAGAGQTDQHIAGLQVLAGDQILAVYHTYRKTRQAILVLRHQSGVLCRLAADQSCACLTAAFRYALYDIRDLLRFILAAGNICLLYTSPHDRGSHSWC